MGNNLFTFLANRLNMSFTNLNCQNFGLTNPVTVTLDGNGVATAATINATQQAVASMTGPAGRPTRWPRPSPSAARTRRTCDRNPSRPVASGLEGQARPLVTPRRGGPTRWLAPCSTGAAAAVRRYQVRPGPVRPGTRSPGTRSGPDQAGRANGRETALPGRHQRVVTRAGGEGGDHSLTFPYSR